MNESTAPNWRTSSYSDGLQCVQVATIGDHVVMRHSRHTDGPALQFTRSAMAAFLSGAKAGEFDDLT